MSVNLSIFLMENLPRLKWLGTIFETLSENIFNIFFFIKKKTYSTFFFIKKESVSKLLFFEI